MFVTLTALQEHFAPANFAQNTHVAKEVMPVMGEYRRMKTMARGRVSCTSSSACSGKQIVARTNRARFHTRTHTHKRLYHTRSHSFAPMHTYTSHWPYM